MGRFYVNVWLYDLAKYLFLDTLRCHGLVSATVVSLNPYRWQCYPHSSIKLAPFLLTTSAVLFEWSIHGLVIYALFGPVA